jgi:hypothetical protein
MPHKASKAAQILYSLRQSAAVAERALKDAEVDLKRFEALPKPEQDSAEKALDTGDLIKVSKSLLAARKPAKP